ncbi:MAG TPA: sulfate adenylyltransferase subunit CysN [Granulicella sp.]|jgi:sulfate adenylyltransferase large subunit|nr:sulfate adenylyltransferase subunit CysN [Granulicella sp.]
MSLPHHNSTAVLDQATETPDESIFAPTFAIEEFLAVEQTKDLLRFSTAGSVDDGKSTLIGRLLYDSRNVYEDQVRAVTGTTTAPGQKQPSIDFAQLTDGLRAEREQGITIDVAYRYFSTQRRKFIIADTPGHEQYTRNMATGASTASLAIILIDARKGILTQSRRHAYIASLLGIRHLVAAINKMDLVDFSEDVYNQIATDLHAMVKEFGSANLATIPVSALEGDNVVEPSTRTPWYTGPTLLQHLEQVPVSDHDLTQGFRLPIQRVIRPDQHYRGFAGQIAAGTIRPGDEVVALPSGRTSRIASITTFDGDLDKASAPQSIALTLEDELDISRGDLLVAPSSQPEHATHIEATLVWFDAQRLESHKPYLLKHGAQTLNARIPRVLHRTNIHSLEQEAVHALAMNDIGTVELATTRPLFFDRYTDNRATGSFILIDPATNATAAAGMIRRGLNSGLDDSNNLLAHKSALLRIPNPTQAAAVEQLLLDANIPVVRTRVRSHHITQSLLHLGIVVILEAEAAAEVELQLEILDASTHTPEAFLAQLRQKGILPAPKGAQQ